MKRIDATEMLKAELASDSRLSTLQTMIEAQINALEKLLESNVSSVKDAGAWNVVCGYVEQLKFWAPRIFYNIETNLDWFEKSEGAPAHPLVGRE
jgi:hypothetical protein